MHRMGSATVNKVELMLSTAEVSRLLHVHPNTLRRWSNNGIIKTYRIGPRADRRFRQDDIDHFLVQLRENRGNPHKCSL
jgi:excisionase family DNA binding protein